MLSPETWGYKWGNKTSTNFGFVPRNIASKTGLPYHRLACSVGQVHLQKWTPLLQSSVLLNRKTKHRNARRACSEWKQRHKGQLEKYVHFARMWCECNSGEPQMDKGMIWMKITQVSSRLWPTFRNGYWQQNRFVTDLVESRKAACASRYVVRGYFCCKEFTNTIDNANMKRKIGM